MNKFTPDDEQEIVAVNPALSYDEALAAQRFAPVHPELSYDEAIARAEQDDDEQTTWQMIRHNIRNS